MKRIRISSASCIAVSFLSALLLFMNLPVTSAAPALAAEKKIVVYYFHGEFRCHTCMEIERLTKKSISVGFIKEMAGSKIALKIINIDKPENKHFVTDYKLETKSVIVSEFNGSKLVRWKNLPKIWDYTNNENLFIKYIQDGVKGYL